MAENAFMDDNLHWSDSEDAAARAKDMFSHWQFPLCSEYMSLIICHKGVLTVQVKGEEIAVGASHAMVIVGGLPIEKVTVSRDCRVLVFACAMGRIWPQLDLDDVNQILRHAVEEYRPLVFPVSSREYRAAEKLYFSAKEFLQMVSKESGENVMAGYARIVLALLADKLGRTAKAQAAKATGGDRTILSDFLVNVREYCRKERGVPFYADKAHLTTKYFSRLIKNISGKPPGAIIREYTMAEAKSLLASKRYSVKEVGAMLNFAGPSSFCKYFKAAAGCSPGEYVKNNLITT